VAIRAERARLEELIEGLRHRRTDLVDELQAVDERLWTASSRHHQLGQVLGEEDPQPALWEPEVREVLAGRPAVNNDDDGLLRGAAIRHAAVRAALADAEPARPRHYREWLDLIEAGGRRIDGRDPGATLLTQLYRCPLIVRTPEPGTYQLDRGALDGLEARREAVHAEAATQVKSAAAHEHAAIDLVHALAGIEAEVRRADRAIAEANELIEALDARDFFPGLKARPAAVAVAVAVAA
jgi:hypothetical protein